MGQLEAKIFLEEKRVLSDEWFNIPQIKEALLSRGCSENSLNKNLASWLYKLAAFDLIQVRGVGLWRHYKQFRGYKNGRSD